MLNVTGQIHCARRDCLEGIITELKESVSQSLKTWVNTFQSMIDNRLFWWGFFHIFSSGLKWYLAAVDGVPGQFSIQSHHNDIERQFVSLLESLMLSQWLAPMQC